MSLRNAAGAAAVAFLLSAGIAGAQTTTPTTTPGTPNTGSGGNAAGNAILLGASALVALGGTVLLARRYSGE